MQALRIQLAFSGSHPLRMLHRTLNERRKQIGLTYEDVHDRLQRWKWSDTVRAPSLAVVGHWFNGTRRPRNMEHLRALCGVLDISIDEATGGQPHTAATAIEQALLAEARTLDDESIQLLIAMARRLKG